MRMNIGYYLSSKNFGNSKIFILRQNTKKIKFSKQYQRIRNVRFCIIKELSEKAKILWEKRKINLL